MAKKKNNYFLLVSIIIVIVFGSVLILNSNKNVSNEFTCDPPYIKVGNSCCLDQNDNGICDKDEQTKNILELNSFMVDGGTSEDFAVCSKDNPQGIPAGYAPFAFNLEDINSKNIELSLKKYDKADYSKEVIYENPDYQTAVLVVYTNYDSSLYGLYDEFEGATCEVEEYYDGVFNEVNTRRLVSEPRDPSDEGIRTYAFVMALSYSQNDKPSEAKYIISCKGDESGKEVKRTFRFNIDYVEKTGITYC